MKNNIFRPVSFWKSAVMTMPDNSFYELLRSVFGKIKTPFKKQQLLNDLESFLLREDIQKTIASYINENDAKIIAAIALLNEPVPEQLEKFFSCEFSYAQLQDIIVNLEERFILYRFQEEKTNSNTYSRLALNPVIKSVLQPLAEDISSLFPVIPAEDNAFLPAPEHKAVFGDLIIAGLLSFVSKWDSFYRTENVIRKRVIESGKTCFPDIDLKYFINSMLVLGLFYIDADRLVPDKKQLEDFGMLSARERREYCAASLLVCSEITSPEVLPPLFRNRIREIINLIHSFLDTLNVNSLYTEKTLKMILEIQKTQTNSEFTSEMLLNILEKTGLIASTTSGLKQLSAIVNNKTADYDKPVIVIDSGFSILVYPEINFTDAISLASFMNICEASQSFMAPVIRFELNKDSAVRAFDNNISADEIIKLLNRLSGEKAGEILIWNLKDWEKRHEEVSLKKGIVLTLSEEHRHLAKTMQFAELITETLAPGLYLLNENAEEDAAAVLRSAGVDIIARRKEKKKHNPFTSNYFPKPLSLPIQGYLPASNKVTLKKKNASSAWAGHNASSLITEFQTMLGKMSLSEPEKAELSARINRRLVLCETQLKEANLRYEKLEARHMDYAGKQNIAKQAISQQSPVEIIWRKKGINDEEIIFGIPKALEKEGSELYLVIDTMRIPLAKISLLRRIKKSIFEV